ncbi:hypothetical protein BC831DRAFT_454302 [Entophlyctis helioformis]|nr:hypothetical protein BC831DRAFT_454302 [Entophlyctis helioformis]
MENSQAELRRRMLAMPTIRKEKYIVTGVDPNAAKAEDKKPELPKDMPVYLSDGSFVSRRLYDVIELLKEEDRPLSRNDLVRKVFVEAKLCDEFISRVRYNERIKYDEATEMFTYNPEHKVGSKEALLELLKELRGKAVMTVKELLESNANVVTLIEELEKDGSVTVVRNMSKEGRPARLVYYNDKELNLTMSKEFMQHWHNVKLPPESDIGKELEKAGLKSADVITMSKPVQIKAKSKAKRKTRFKLTNTHLEGVDLTKDPVMTQ